MGEPSCEKSGRRSHNGAPTGSTGRTDIPFTTPAADVYHATAAVTTPAQPPAWRIHSLPPWARLKKPITSRISVISSVRKTRKTATLTRELQKSMYVLKMEREQEPRQPVEELRALDRLRDVVRDQD